MDNVIKMNEIDFYPLTPERWADFETLFGAHGACCGCWCMFWRMTRKEFNQGCGEANKQAMADLVNSGGIPGIIGYQEGKPIGWCSVAPREEFASLERSRNLKRIDDKPVWAIVCFYIAKTARKTGYMTIAIKAAVDYAHRNGAEIVEAYPTDVREHRPPGDLYMGDLNTFLKVGFKVIAERGSHKIVRFQI